jgi:Mn2+/Fe2+ NRAMP family transporter
VAGSLAPVNWGLALRSLVIPSFRMDPGYLMIFIATIGTTITPWMQFYLQASIVDKGITAKQYKYEKADVLFGAFVTDFISFFIIVTCAATLFSHGIRVESAQDAALALAPISSRFASALFAIGLFGASILTASIVPLSTAYAVSEAFGFESGVSKKFSEAPVFFGLFTFMILIGVAAVLYPGLSLIKVMVLSQTVNGILLPVVLIFILLLVNRPEVMGKHVNGRIYNLVSWVTAAGIILLTVLLLVTTLFPVMRGF